MGNGFRELKVWQEAKILAVDVYNLIRSAPLLEQDWGLKDQMQRAAVSIPSNIAEGAARQSTKEFIRYLQIASGSLSELETQLILSINLGLLNKKQKEYVDASEKILTLRKQIYATIRSLRLRL